jgi:Transposase DDE domain group 1
MDALSFADMTVPVRGLNALIGAVSTPLAAPVAAAVRLRGGNAPSARGAASLAAQAIGTARACGCTGTIVVRMDSAYYAAAVIAAIRRSGARFSVTAPVSAAIRAAIAAIPQGAWQAIKYPQAVWDDQLGCWVSDAEVAETSYAAFTSKNKALQVTARLIVRRVRDKARTAPGQGELFPAWRYHAVFTDSPFELVQAEEQHRGHAVIEQLLADLNDGPLAHLPSGKFTANAAWLAIAAIAHNLLRAAGTLAGRRHARAREATIRRDLIAVAARTARHGRGLLTLRLPEGWHREREWLNLFEAACGPPAAAAGPAQTRSAPSRPPGMPLQTPTPEPTDKPQNRQRQGNHASKALVKTGDRTEIIRWIEAKAQGRSGWPGSR